MGEETWVVLWWRNPKVAEGAMRLWRNYSTSGLKMVEPKIWLKLRLEEFEKGL